MTPDQQRGLRDVPKPWHAFLGKWHADVAQIIATGIDPLFKHPPPGRRQTGLEIVRLREEGRSYEQIGVTLDVSSYYVRLALMRYRPDLIGRWGERNA